jgi:hypothetical protein
MGEFPRFKKIPLTEEYIQERFRKSYENIYKKPSGVIYSTIEKSISECGYPKKKHYYLGDGWKIHLRNGWDENLKKEFEEKLIELVQKYNDINQIEQNDYLVYVANEKLRALSVNKSIEKRYDSRSRVKRAKKQRISIASFKFKGELKHNTRTLLKNPSPNFYGEYFKNSSDEVKIMLSDDTQVSKDKQYKEMSLELFEHFVKHNLLEFIEDRDAYKKFYFSQEYMTNPSKYIRINSKRNIETLEILN